MAEQISPKKPVQVRSRASPARSAWQSWAQRPATWPTRRRSSASRSREERIPRAAKTTRETAGNQHKMQVEIPSQFSPTCSEPPRLFQMDRTDGRTAASDRMNGQTQTSAT